MVYHIFLCKAHIIRTFCLSQVDTTDWYNLCNRFEGTLNSPYKLNLNYLLMNVEFTRNLNRRTLSIGILETSLFMIPALLSKTRHFFTESAIKKLHFFSYFTLLSLMSWKIDRSVPPPLRVTCSARVTRVGYNHPNPTKHPSLITLCSYPSCVVTNNVYRTKRLWYKLIEIGQKILMWGGVIMWVQQGVEGGGVA